jgi:hypothetical protein
MDDGGLRIGDPDVNPQSQIRHQAKWGTISTRR